MDKESKSILILVGIISTLLLLPTTMQSYAQINSPICCQGLDPGTGPLPDVPLPDDTTPDDTTPDDTTPDDTTPDDTTPDDTTPDDTTPDDTTPDDTTPDDNNMGAFFANQGSAEERAHMADQIEKGLFGDIMQ
jgi:hypothetical protein